MLYYISPFYTCTPPCKYVNITSTLFQFSSIYNIAQQFLIFVTLIRQRIQYASNYLLFSKKNYHAYISSYLNHLFHHILSIVSISCVFIFHFYLLFYHKLKGQTEKMTNLTFSFFSLFIVLSNRSKQLPTSYQRC